jgi:hypothetical protein
MSLAHAQTSTSDGARPGNDIGTHSSMPLSNNVSNVTPGDTESTIAPTSPEPVVPPDATVQQLLLVGSQYIASGKTGTADEALEQAETKILTRAVPQMAAGVPSQDPVVAQIETARGVLGSGNNAGAVQLLNQILASNAPELGD